MEALFLILVVLAIFFGWSCFIGWLFMLVWNWLVVGVIGIGSALAFWPAVGIVVALSLIFGFIFPKRGGDTNNHYHRW